MFAKAFNTVVDELDRHLLRPLREVIWGNNENLLITTEFAQHSLFAVEMAFPVVEILGFVSRFRDGSFGGRVVRRACSWCALIGAHCDTSGRPRQVDADFVGKRGDECRVGLRRAGATATGHRLDIAAVNGPASVVLSGAQDAVAAVTNELRARRPPSAPTGRLSRVPLSVYGPDDRRIRSGCCRTCDRAAPPSPSCRM